MLSIKGKTVNPLLECRAHYFNGIKGDHLSFYYKEKNRGLFHSAEPWQVYTKKLAGRVVMDYSAFYRIDSAGPVGKKRVALIQYSTTELLYQGYGDTSLTPQTKTDLLEQPLENARYTPLALLNVAFWQGAMKETINKDSPYDLYKLTIHTTYIQLFINKATDLLDKIVLLKNDDLYGDVTDTIQYLNNTNTGGVTCPSLITISKTNGKVKDTVWIASPAVIQDFPALLKKPNTYKWAEEKKAEPEEVTVEKYNDYIHFINFKKGDSRTMVVEFPHFLLVAEAPQNSTNGEAIIKEAHKMAPGKPIRYFVFGHFHPDYLGGVRSFVHKGVTIISTRPDISYVSYLVQAPHTLLPDSLQYQPKKLVTEILNDSLTIADGAVTMKIYFIGKKSDHTSDYKVYYFPNDKLLFEDDLVWIKKAGELKKAGSRQAGLYNAIKELHIPVNVVLQSWPLSDEYGVKSTIPFADLEKTMSIK